MTEDLVTAFLEKTSPVLDSRAALNSQLGRTGPSDDVRVTTHDPDAIPDGLSELHKAITRGHEATLITAFGGGEDIEETIDKWYRALKPGGDSETTPPTVTYIDGSSAPSDLIVVESKMYSARKADTGDEDDDGWYTAVWVVGEATDIPDQRFWVHRFEWDSSFESDEPWTRDRVQSHLGFDAYLAPDESVEYGIRYHVVGDIVIQVDELDPLITDYVSSATTQDKREAQRNQRADVAKSLYGDVDGIKVNRGFSRLKLRIRPTDTDSLKNLQEELGFTEEEVRDAMKDDWDRLTANRREGILKRLMKQEVKSHTDDVDTDPFREQARTQVESELAEAGTMYRQIDNHLVVIGNGVTSRRLATPRTGLDTVFVPTKTQITFDHDEHDTRTITVPRGRITFDLHDRHQNA
ncbi:hypothetical protein RYH80_18115 [Halobaculum sp. MBLA0147]|uniref:hypothetical protein n=1 Tax=Halobaculum sp. MBLA0147 TaxID=3079934 RepID=UPI0035258D91